MEPSSPSVITTAQPGEEQTTQVEVVTSLPEESSSVPDIEGRGNLDGLFHKKVGFCFFLADKLNFSSTIGMATAPVVLVPLPVPLLFLKRTPPHLASPLPPLRNRLLILFSQQRKKLLAEVSSVCGRDRMSFVHSL